ncbi:MAG TPA: DivIVA domain-containing protein [Segeticoccus sp.]|uniref:DivIVA domain-containing protein n=1 Tax=Segeticoccus sp. TaxID=2706531 RepID=UPI002D801AA9|nr:DivIVA domain-containing protein [Segeticoccus sp.]HET8599690.1 DivIVA domain-containing protein [Segeticoccus sp.]
MPLTPEDVSNKRFTPVRLREGYDMGEVDQFLDEVESELERLYAENDDLRSKLAAAQQGGAPAPAAPEPVVEKAPEKAPEPAPQAPAAAAAPATQEIRVTTVGEASSAAARLLEMATHNADQLVAEAKDEADKIVGAARTKAERLETESKTRADRMESDARTRAQMLDSETEARRKELFGDLDKEKERLDTDIENLRAFEREYRSRLKSYFTQQLEALETGGDLSSGQPGETAAAGPKRLKSILGEGEDSQARS